MGRLVAQVHCQSFAIRSAVLRAHAEGAIVTWALAQEVESWDIDAESSEIGCSLSGGELAISRLICSQASFRSS